MTELTDQEAAMVQLLHPIIEGVGSDGYCRWQTDSLCPHYAITVYAVRQLRPFLAAARAEGARDMRTKIETRAERYELAAESARRRHDRLDPIGGEESATQRAWMFWEHYREAGWILRALLADGGEPQPQKVERCGIDAGSRPYWMGVDQYDPCPCVRPKGHDGEHGCADHDKPADAVGGEPQ